jgi:iron complex outermembrane receptor protein
MRNPIYLGLAAALIALPSYGDDLEELIVTARHDTRTINVTDELSISPDVAQLLKKAPGASVNGNGPLTGIPQYRGMYGPRVATSMNGAQLAPSGPNWMDPPISYAIGGQLESLEIYRGIVPVSVAQEAIGGAIDARANRGNFTAGEDFELSGRMIGSAQTVNSGYHLNTAVYAGNRNHRIKAAAMTESGDDAEFKDGDITPTEYERQRYDLGYGFRSGDHTLQLDYGYNDTGDSGTPALPMDIESIEGDLYNLSYTLDRDPSGLQIAIDLYASDLDHRMTNYELRDAPPVARWRRNTAASDNLGFNVATTLLDETGRWVIGFDGFSAECSPSGTRNSTVPGAGNSACATTGWKWTPARWTAPRRPCPRDRCCGTPSTAPSGTRTTTTSTWSPGPGTRPARRPAGTPASPGSTAPPATRSATCGCPWKPPAAWRTAIPIPAISSWTRRFPTRSSSGLITATTA